MRREYGLPAHALLRSAHLARRNHFHGTSDLLRALNARDLSPYFFSSCHFTLSYRPYQVCVLLNVFNRALKLASISSL